MCRSVSILTSGCRILAAVCFVCDQTVPVKMDFKWSDFVEQPTLDLFNRCTKEQLVEIADHFKVGTSKQLRV